MTHVKLCTQRDLTIKAPARIISRTQRFCNTHASSNPLTTNSLENGN